MKAHSLRRTLILIPALMFVVAPICALGAETPLAVITANRPQGDTSSFNLEGKIAKVEAGKFTVSTEENIIFHVAYTDKTEITHEDGTPATSKELRVKVYVKVEGDLTESGEIVAKKISIQKDSSSKPPDSK